MDRLFDGPGEMRTLLRSVDWEATPLGPVADWPQSLRTTVSNALASHFPMCVYWGKDYIQLYNDAFLSILGHTKHPGAVGRRAADTWAEIWDYVGPRFDDVLRTGEAMYAEDQLLFPELDGLPEERYYRFSYSPVRDERGDVFGLLNTVTQTTERVLGERRFSTLHRLATATAEATSATEACQRAAGALADNVLDLPFALIYLTDPDEGQARLAAATELPDARIGPATVDLSGDRAVWPLAEALAGPVTADLGTRFPGLTGGPWQDPLVAAMLLPLRPGADEPPAGVLVAGLSARRVFDDPYRSFLDLVTGQVAAGIAAAVAAQRDRERIEALAALDRAKTAFLSNISHEFRTPLTLLLGPLSDVLEHAPALTAGHRESLLTARRAALRLQRLVDAMLDAGRIEEARLSARPEPLDVAEVTAQLAAMFRSAVEKAGLTLTVDCPPLSRPASVDPAMWENIVLNLLSNAVKFTLAGGIEVRVREQADTVVLEVLDTGVGIPPGEEGQVFERFHRLENPAARSAEGAGIGLALVADMARLHGGTAEVHSRPGGGSRFTVTLPHPSVDGTAGSPRSQPSRVTAMRVAGFVAEAERWLPAAAAAPAAAAPDRRPPVARGRVVVAEDNADMADYLRRLLGRQGYTVALASDGARALAEVRSNPPDLLLSDVMMPVMDGLALLRAVRADPAVAQVPVILLTARGGSNAAEEALAAGADDYVVKPFAAAELVARVRTHVDLHRARQRELAERRDQVANLAAGMDSRGRIGQAIGVVMARQRCGPDEAFALLSAVSQQRNRKLRDLVEDLLDGGVEIPA